MRKYVVVMNSGSNIPNTTFSIEAQDVNVELYGSKEDIAAFLFTSWNVNTEGEQDGDPFIVAVIPFNNVTIVTSEAVKKP